MKQISFPHKIIDKRPPEIIEGLPFEKYLAGPGMNRSTLKLIDKSPLHFLMAATGRSNDKKTWCKDFGQVVHSTILEPTTLKDSVYVTPATYIDEKTQKEVPWNNRTKQCKQWKEAHGDKLEVSQSDLDTLEGITNALKANPGCAKLLNSIARRELSVYTTDPDTGVRKKCRIDADAKGNVLFDLKSTRDASPAGFPYEIKKYYYHQQAAWYLDIANEAGMEKEFFIWVAFEKEPPYGCSAYCASAQMIELGRKIYKNQLRKLCECLESGNWPGYPENITTIDLPAWAYKNEEE